MDAIRTENLSKVFGELRAVDGVGFTVSSGEVFGLVGPDGAGKTTTMRLLTSIMEPSEGDAWISGNHIVKDAEKIKENIGYMSQKFGLYLDLSVMENINFYADIYGVSKKERKVAIPRLLEFTNLEPFRKRLAGNLSGGMKQKLGLACALIHKPKVLFLDEPTNGVDPVSRRDFWSILYQLLRDNVTIFISTAYLDEAERCSRIGLINNGKILAIDNPANIKKMMEGSILEVRCGNPRKSTTILRKHLPDSKVDLFGDRVHIVTKQPDEVSSRSRQILESENIDITGIREIPPSLEDVFISVLSQTQEDKTK
jgi:ABC-2 type transport system ATP-binding protein